MAASPDIYKETVMDALSVEILNYAAEKGVEYGLTREDLDEMFITIARLTYFGRTGKRLPASFTLDKDDRQAP